MQDCVILAGIGCGTPDTMTAEVRDSISGAEIWIGARRILSGLPDGQAEKFAATKPGEILTALLENRGRRCCVLYSGDSGFYSGARSLAPLLEEQGIAYRILPGISSVQAMAARMAEPWQGWKLVSAHGVECDAVAAVNTGAPALFLTGGTLGPASLCDKLVRAGLGSLRAVVGENLSYETEKIIHGTAAEFLQREFAPLSVLWVEAAPKPWNGPCQGIRDEEFIRGSVPMTKREVRACAVSMAAPSPGAVLWDVGAGTGSISVELALSTPSGRVFAVECEQEGIDLIRRNRERFGAWNVTPVHGKAPDALADLPAPDAVFIGGTKGGLAEILDIVLEKNPSARIVISAVTMETIAQSSQLLTECGLEFEATQISAARTRQAGRFHMMAAQNPVFLIEARKN
ncbi:MAG TPA: precorrin-6y C5,15-methyltransferase (decarboxylating) subunit CbiE [Candidatus Gallacutalibacter pullicola]|uniref:Precorrin-6y C5,15-methyltransferase (Decarboxylating) subunit CbiE n=1 Tax=Candidatus Gallacutalibacter pullicola TaxID=2840830 RepID=A0A9D1J163_9FIRM|nr:precorrin-6y C5,15-methyltransferase (decarboxylating) subunit CbiE [Candidatus Gallacutalibacter pullicola]